MNATVCVVNGERYGPGPAAEAGPDEVYQTR